VRALYKLAIPAESIAQAIAYVIAQPAEVDVNELLVRPTEQEF
jgi:NADP-dependent 3-hydroxy acid dehydrogenase YdfG